MRSIFFLSLMNGAAWGGSEEQWYQVALWMSRNSYNVGVAVFDWENKSLKLDELRKNGCRIFIIPNDGRGIFKVWKQKKTLNKIPFNDYDLVYVNQGGWKDITHGPFKSFYKKLPPFALSFHNYELGANLTASKVKDLNSWIQKSIVCISATGILYEMLKNEYSILIANKEISYSPISFLLPELPVPYPEIIDQPVIFLVLSALDISRKAQEVLIRVLSDERWKNRNWQLHLYGEGKDKFVIEGLIEELGLQSKVLLKGFTGKVTECLIKGHMLIQATRFDAMPISVIEAMAMARPCLVSCVGDMPQWITSGENGFITEIVNEKSLNEQLEIAWSRKKDWEQMGIKAFDTFQSKYPRPYEDKFVKLLNHYFMKHKT